MTELIRPEVEAYASAHSTPESDVLARVAADTRAGFEAHGMMVGHLEGALLATLVSLAGAREVLEIGTFTGYSALAMAAALPPDGRVVTCEIDPAVAAKARANIATSPWSDRIEVRVGPAIDTLDLLDGPFDLVFIDADKTGYRAYYEAVLPKLAPRGLIAVDNVLWSGAVLDPGPAPDDADGRALAEFNDHVAADQRVSCVMLTVRDGLTLVRRRS